MSASASKVISDKISSSVQSGDASSVLKISLMVGGAILLVILLVFLYNKFVAKKPKNEYFENNEYFTATGEPVATVETEDERLAREEEERLAREEERLASLTP